MGAAYGSKVGGKFTILPFNNDENNMYVLQE